MSEVVFPGARGLSRLAVRLASARLKSSPEDRWLTTLSVAAFASATCVATLVSAGAWMFYRRSAYPGGLMAKVLAADPSFSVIQYAYLGLTVLACALLIGPIAGLASSAAVLGARSRESRLATLRLLGLSSAEASRMTILETTVQAFAGAVIGLAVSFAVLPLFGGLKFQAQQVMPSEMVLGWWVYPLIAAVVVLVSAAAAWWGLQRVRISPLGVARGSLPPALRVWRLVLPVVGVTAAVLMSNGVKLGKSSVTPYALIAAFLLVVIWLANLALPYLLQVLTRPVAALPWPALTWAARRVVMDPRAAWRRISTLAMVCFVAGFIAAVPFLANRQLDPDAQTLSAAVTTDVSTGTALVVGFSFLLAAVASLLGQASATFERAGELRALSRMGAPWGYAIRAAWWEALAPLLLSCLAFTGLGWLAAQPMRANLAELPEIDPNLLQQDNSALGLWTIVIGVALVIASLCANLPVQRLVTASISRSE